MTTSLTMHNVTTASAEVSRVNTSRWLTLSFEDAYGGAIEVVLFSKSPEALLASLCAAVQPSIVPVEAAEGEAS